MKRAIKLLVILTSSLFISCDDVFEDDISDRTIQTTYPSQGITITENLISFQWLSIEGADDYRIQIIEDDNSNIIVLDSLVPKSGFTYSLDSGSYKWRVRGENFAYQTDYSFSVSFIVEISNDLGNQTVILNTPANDLYTNNKELTYTWNSLAAASTYSFELQKNGSSLETILQEDDINDVSYTPQETLYDEDAEYIWRIKAVNEISESNFYSRSVFIDTQNPSQPTLGLPDADSSSNSSIVMFSWTNSADIGNVKSAIATIIEISDDENFNNIINTSTLTGNEYEYTFLGTGDFYWRVKAEDIAGNESDYSEVRKITIN